MTCRAIVFAALLLTAALGGAQITPAAIPGLHRGGPDQPNNAPLSSADPVNFKGTVTGSVVTLDDHAVPDARVEVRTLDDSRAVATVYSNQRGAFEIDDIPYGEYELVAVVDLRESHEHIEVRGMQVAVTLRVANNDASSAGGRASVSVAQMQVPDKARKAYKKAEEAFSHGKIDEARGSAVKALEIYPDYAEALTLKGILDLQKNKPEDARAGLEKAVQCDASYGMAYIVLGATYNALHRFDDAARVLARGINYSPNAWQAYFERARALEGKQEWSASLADLDKAAQLINKDFPVLHLVRANDLIGLKAYPEAQAELQAFLNKETVGPNADEARRVLERVKAATATAQK